MCFASAEVLLRLTTRLLGAEALDEQQVHAGTTEKQILDALDAAEERARVRQEGKKDGSKEQIVVQFWDEVNTSPHQPLFKQILVDRINPRTGQPIHSSLRFVAACNPWRLASQASVVSVGFESPVSKHDRLAGLAYRVHPLPESLFVHLSSFGQLTSHAEVEYVKEMASQQPQLLDPDDCQLNVPPLSTEMCSHVAGICHVLHDFFRELGSCVSLRDPMRLLRIWGFIRWEMNQRDSTLHGDPNGQMCPQAELVSLVLSIHLAYELRLSDLKKRQELLKTLFQSNELRQLFQRHFPGEFKDGEEGMEIWSRIVLEEQNYWLNAIDVPDNVAKVRALREKTYAALMCSMTRTPIMILGKPGCSKSLTVSLLITAMTNPHAKQLLHLASFSVQPYQGSRQSTSSSLLQVFERARGRQKKLRELKNRKTRPLALVLLDEVHL